MPLWFARGLRRGVVTTRYPDRPEPAAALLPTPPAFRPSLLTAQVAERLVQACPSAALRLSEAAMIFDAGACTACGRCAEAAPHAVAASGEWELATTARSALIKEIPLAGEARQ